MRRSCRCLAAAAQHPADRRAQLLVLSMRAAKPTTRPPLSFQQFGPHSLDVLAPRSAFFGESTQQIHSLRARGVRSSQAARTFGLAIKTRLRSIGTVWTTPPATTLELIDRPS